ncbi:MAG: hypothetical protein R3B93_18280 [Bacteroidia bacterium]
MYKSQNLSGSKNSDEQVHLSEVTNKKADGERKWENKTFISNFNIQLQKRSLEDVYGFISARYH